MGRRKKKKRSKKKLNPQAKRMKQLARRWNKLKKSTKEKYGSFANYVKAMSRR